MKKNGKTCQVGATKDTKRTLANFHGSRSQVRNECACTPFQPASLFPLFGQMEEEFGRIEATFGHIEDALLQIFANQTVAPADVALPFCPPVDISESDSEWLIEVEMPGFPFENIKVEVQRGTLCLQATPEPSPESHGERHYHRRERHLIWKERKLSLPEGVAQEKITCDYINGILRCHLPKEHATPTRHPVPVTPGNLVAVAPGDS